MAALAYDCAAWNALQQPLRHFQALKHFEGVDKVQATLNDLAIKIMADSRRVAAVQASCPKILPDIQACAATAGTPGQIANPAHHPAILDAWLKGLPDDTLSGLKDAVAAEMAQRKKAAPKKR